MRLKVVIVKNESGVIFPPPKKKFANAVPVTGGTLDRLVYF